METNLPRLKEEQLRHEMDILQRFIMKQLTENPRADVSWWQRKVELKLEKLIAASAEPPATCACCGYQGLKHPRFKTGVILGPCCIGHYPGKHCKGR